MKKSVKWILIIFIVSLGIILTGYGAYRLYNYVLADATRKIKQGIKEGVGGALNPLSWPGKLLSGGKGG